VTAADGGRFLGRRSPMALAGWRSSCHRPFFRMAGAGGGRAGEMHGAVRPSPPRASA